MASFRAGGEAGAPAHAGERGDADAQASGSEGDDGSHDAALPQDDLAAHDGPAAHRRAAVRGELRDDGI